MPFPPPPLMALPIRKEFFFGFPKEGVNIAMLKMSFLFVFYL